MIKKIVYFVVFLCMIGGWSGYNYSNYLETQSQAKETIKENFQMIDSTVDNINQEQRKLEMVQEAFGENSELAPAVPGASAGFMSKPFAFEGEPLNEIKNPMYVELQKRIQELEKEKERYRNEKSIIAKEILGVITLFKWDIENPLINIVILPLLVYHHLTSQ